MLSPEGAGGSIWSEPAGNTDRSFTEVRPLRFWLQADMGS